VIRPPADEPKVINGRRALVLVASTSVLVAMLLGFLMGSGRQHIPSDPGTPATVTTIGGPR